MPLRFFLAAGGKFAESGWVLAAAIEAIANRFIEAAKPEPERPTLETRERW